MLLTSATTAAEFDEFLRNKRSAFEVDFCGIVLAGPDGWAVRAFQSERLRLRAGSSALLRVAIAGNDSLVIPDASADVRVDPVDEGIRFFGAWPIVSDSGQRIGFFVLADPEPKVIRPSELHHMDGITKAILYTLGAEKEMSYAATVQRALSPRNRVPMHGYDVAGCCIPTSAVGGDFYDWYPVEGGLALSLGDVMGKGVGAGIIAARVGAVLKSAARNTNVAAAVNRASETLADELNDANSFFTLFHARINSGSGLISFVDAGHGLSIIVGADGSSRRLEGADVPVGMAATHSWTRHRAYLSPGDTLIAVSDGVLDLYDGTLRSLDHVVNLAKSATSAEHLVGMIEQLARSASAPDDVTAVAITRK